MQILSDKPKTCPGSLLLFGASATLRVESPPRKDGGVSLPDNTRLRTSNKEQPSITDSSCNLRILKVWSSSSSFQLELPTYWDP